VDELDDAAKKANRDATAHRQARAYKLRQIVLTAAMQQHQLIEGPMTVFLASAPKLAASWRAGNQTTRRGPPSGPANDFGRGGADMACPRPSTATRYCVPSPRCSSRVSWPGFFAAGGSLGRLPFVAALVFFAPR